MPIIANEFGQIINDKDPHYLALCEYAYDMAPHVYTSSRALHHYLQDKFYRIAEKRTYSILASARRCSHDNRGKDMLKRKGKKRNGYKKKA